LALSKERSLAIYSDLLKGKTHQVICRDHDVTGNTVSRIAKGRNRFVVADREAMKAILSHRKRPVKFLIMPSDVTKFRAAVTSGTVKKEDYRKNVLGVGDVLAKDMLYGRGRFADRKVWGEPLVPAPNKNWSSRRATTHEQDLEMLRLFRREAMTFQEIADRFKVDLAVVSHRINAQLSDVDIMIIRGRNKTLRAKVRAEFGYK